MLSVVLKDDVLWEPHKGMILQSRSGEGFNQLSRGLQVSPVDRYGSTYEIYYLFGGSEKLLQAVDEIQKSRYED